MEQRKKQYGKNNRSLPYPLSKTQKNHSGFPDSQPLKTFVIITIRVFFIPAYPSSLCLFTCPKDGSQKSENILLRKSHFPRYYYLRKWPPYQKQDLT